MTEKLPAPNWAEIRVRYIVNGEKPSVIAKDYDVRVASIYHRASVEDWLDGREEVADELMEYAVDVRKEIATTYLREILEIGHEIYKARKDGLIGLTAQSGEGLPNKFYTDAYKAGLDIAKGSADMTIQTGDKKPVTITFVAPDDDRPEAS